MHYIILVETGLEVWCFMSKPMSRKYIDTINRLEGLLDDEHCSCCDSLTCDVDVCFDDGYTLWAIELFSGSGASSDEFNRLYSKLPKRFRADSERERKLFVKDTEHAECPHCNAVTWHTEHFNGSIPCESYGKTYSLNIEYLMAVKRGRKSELFSFNTEEDRDAFIVSLRKDFPKIQYATSERTKNETTI